MVVQLMNVDITAQLLLSLKFSATILIIHTCAKALLMREGQNVGFLVLLAQIL
jgi:hypothetical protein